jgi:hypothetical protein
MVIRQPHHDGFISGSEYSIFARDTRLQIAKPKPDTIL